MPIHACFAQVTYLMPSLRTALVYDKPPYPAWPANWIEKKLSPIVIKVLRRKPLEWNCDAERAMVQFSFLPTKGGKVPAKYRPSLQAAIRAIEDGAAAVGSLESDAEVGSEADPDDVVDVEADDDE